MPESSAFAQEWKSVNFLTINSSISLVVKSRVRVDVVALRSSRLNVIVCHVIFGCHRLEAAQIGG